MEPRQFERERLTLFARHGFEAKSRWIRHGDGRETYCLERGEGPRPSILLHGGLSEASEWSPFAGRMPGHVLIPDRPGFGLTYSMDYQGVDFRASAVQWMAELLDGIGAEQVDLVANSLGGYFALVSALAHPERIRRLVLVGAPAGLHQEIPFFLRLWGNPVTGPLISRMKIDDPEVFRKRVIGAILTTHPERVPVDVIRIMVAAAALPGVDRTAYSLLRNVSTLRGWRAEMSLQDDVLQLQVPTLFLWGERDAFAPPSRGEGLAARIDQADFRVLPDGGHLPYLDQPEAVEPHVLEFLAKG